MALLKRLADFIFPPQCLGCGCWGSYLCSNCLNYLNPCRKRICPVCGKPSLAGLTHPGCQKKRGLDGLTSIFTYQGLIKKAIIKLKYQFVADLSQTILELFLSFSGEDKAFCHFVLNNKPILTPIPLHWQRKNWRGFNQAKLLGKTIAFNLGLNFKPNLLIRVKKTKPQTALNKKQRATNIKGAFAINRQSVNQAKKTTSNKTSIILFDDVWTTGATLKEAAKVLKANGFKKVWALTLARQAN